MITAIVDLTKAITGWGGIEFLVFVILVIVMIMLYKFVSGR